MSTSTPEEARHARIESLRVDEEYLRGLHLDFHPGVTILIGLLGAAKSTVIELLRFVLGAPVPPERLEGALGAGSAHVSVRTRHGAVLEGSGAFGSKLLAVGSGGEEIGGGASSVGGAADADRTRENRIAYASLADPTQGCSPRLDAQGASRRDRRFYTPGQDCVDALSV